MGFSAIVALAALGRGWPIASYAILTAGAAFKIVPVLLVPVFVLAAATQSQRFWPAFWRHCAYAATILIAWPVLVYGFGGGDRAFVFLKYHTAHGLELGSAYSVPVLLADSCEVRYEYGGYALRGSLADQRGASFAGDCRDSTRARCAGRGPRAPPRERYGSSHADRQRVRPGVVIVHPDRESGVAAVSPLGRAACAAITASKPVGLSGRGRLRRGLRFDDIDLPLSLAERSRRGGPGSAGRLVRAERAWLRACDWTLAGDCPAIQSGYSFGSGRSRPSPLPGDRRQSCATPFIAVWSSSLFSSAFCCFARALRDHHGKRARALSRLRDPCAQTHHSPNSIVRTTSSIRRWPRSLVSSYFTWRMRSPRKPNASHAGVPNQRAEPPGLATKLRWGLSCSPLILPAWHSFISSGSGSTRTTAHSYILSGSCSMSRPRPRWASFFTDRQDLVVALVAAMAVGADRAGDGPFPRTSYSRPEPPISSFRFFSCRRACWPSRPSVGGRAQVANSLLPRCAKR